MIESVSDAKKLFEDHYFRMHRRFPLTIIRGEGCYVFDDEGKSYLDALSGIAVNSLGHCHPKVVSAIQRQAAQLMHVSNFYYNLPQSELAQKLTRISGMDRAFFCNSGAEANEGAVKLARKYAAQHGKHGNIISFENCFHGRTLTTVAMGKRAYQEGFDPMPEGFQQIPFNDIAALNAITEDTVAVFIEFIQGEGGVAPASEAFVNKLKQKCANTNTLLVADEIQTGIGRTGQWFAFQHYNIKPDIVTLAKGLGTGFPIGAVLSSDEISKVFTPGSHSSTFGGNPLACAVGNTVLDTIIEDKLIENASAKGRQLMEKLKETLLSIDVVEEIRGAGLMIGIVMHKHCQQLGGILMQNGLLVSCTAGNVIRLVPPLIIGDREIEEIVKILTRSIHEWSEIDDNQAKK